MGRQSLSYENDERKKVESNIIRTERIDIGLLRYLWQAGPFSLKREESLPRFLAKVSALSSFSNNELRILSKYLHMRSFKQHEVIFHQGDSGYGFYFVYTGSIDIVHLSGKEDQKMEHAIARLERYQYFGEMGLLQKYNRRNATAVSAEETCLLGLFKPDLETMLHTHPVVGAKFLREISLIIANRLGALMETVTELRHRLGEEGISQE